MGITVVMARGNSSESEKMAQSTNGSERFHVFWEFMSTAIDLHRVAAMFFVQMLKLADTMRSRSLRNVLSC